MNNGKFDVGTVIKGEDLKGEIFCKVLTENMDMRGFQYKIGINEDVKPLATEGSCKAGLHFCLVKNICRYLCYGSKLALVSIPDDEDVYIDNNKFRTHRLEIKKIMHLGDVATWMYLRENGADITAYGDYAVKWAAGSGYLEVVKYLHENGADITSGNNEAVRWAAKYGHLKVVMYLHTIGADITTLNNEAVICAASAGCLETVKYLHQNGADITAENNQAFICAARWGHLKVVKYLHRNGADITAKDNCAIRLAAQNGRTDVVEYLKANM